MDDLPDAPLAWCEGQVERTFGQAFHGGGQPGWARGEAGDDLFAGKSLLRHGSMCS
jgi:hypothetical protein